MDEDDRDRGAQRGDTERAEAAAPQFLVDAALR
jgi:hypothetical protein